MFVYLDESGDSGFKIGRGSSEYFVLGIVMTENPVPVASALVDLKTRFSVSQREEIKFNKSNERLRIAFYEEIRRLDLTICGFSVNKRLLADSPNYRMREWFYSSLIVRALQYHRLHFVNATIVMDEYMTSRKSRMQLNALMRGGIQEDLGEINGVAMKRVKALFHRDSRTESLLQVADMVAGAIHYDRRGSGSTYLDLLQPRISEIHDWHGHL